MVEVGVTLVIALPAAVLRVVPEVKNVPVVGVTLVTTVVFVVVPFRNGTVSKGPIWPGLLGLVNTIVPLLLVVVLPLGLKANTAGGLLLFGIDVSTATVRKLGLDDPGVMPVTVPVVEVTLVTAVPVTGARAALVKNDPDVVVVFTLVKALGRGQQCGVKAADGECCEKCLVRSRRQ